MLHRLIGQNVELNVVSAPSLGGVKADPGQMEQVILNLAVNSRDAMPNGGMLTIETSDVVLSEIDTRNHKGMPPGRYVKLTVSDTGTGMDSETRAHMFEPFYTTKAPGKGTGLGLATVYGVVKQSDGWIWVDSELGRGTTFKIFLPQVEQSQVKAPIAESSARQPLTVAKSSTTSATAARGNETILVVEDQDGIRDMVAESLRRKGYRVLLAADGDQALQIAGVHNDPIHLLVTDLAMPNVGGRELARRLTPLRPRMKVLFMSGYPDHTLPSHPVKDDSSAVLQKPFSLDALAQSVRCALDQQESS
jgi:CheY-like chemotaxis protein